MAESFYDVLSAAVNDMAENGFDSAERVAMWQERIRKAAEATMQPAEVMDRMLKDAYRQMFQKMVDRGQALKLHPGLERFVLERLRPRIWAELEKRIAASADLIRLNREQEIAATQRRFAGWASSIPSGGSDQVKKGEEKTRIRKQLAGLPFIERRVLIDQGAKLQSAISELVAVDGGAIGAFWHSHWRQPNYDYREDHKERDGIFYLVRDSWAWEKGFLKKSGAAFTDQITKPAEEPFCRCYYKYVYNLRSVPKEYLTKKGEEALAAARKELAK
jgi:hypothetical protein